MGVKYGREYSDIVSELAEALRDISGIYRFFDMTHDEWASLEADEKLGCIETLADDVIFALGEDPKAAVGDGYVEYDRLRHVLKVTDQSKTTLVKLI